MLYSTCRTSLGGQPPSPASYLPDRRCFSSPSLYGCNVACTFRYVPYSTRELFFRFCISCTKTAHLEEKAPQSLLSTSQGPFNPLTLAVRYP